jgi:hypothetical protein
MQTVETIYIVANGIFFAAAQHQDAVLHPCPSKYYFT